jgi:hypothetical protein
MDEIEALQILAIKSIEKPDLDYQIRRIQRWYSTTFYTPLKMVDDLDLPFILTHYFEHVYSQMPKEELVKLKNQLIHKEKLQEIEAEDDEWIKQELAAEEAKLKTKLGVEELPDIKMEF